MTGEQKELVKGLIQSILDNILDGSSPELLFDKFNQLLKILELDTTVEELMEELY